MFLYDLFISCNSHYFDMILLAEACSQNVTDETVVHGSSATNTPLMQQK